jgi:hypothetical protein
MKAAKTALSVPGPVKILPARFFSLIESKDENTGEVLADEITAGPGKGMAFTETEGNLNINFW